MNDFQIGSASAMCGTLEIVSNFGVPEALGEIHRRTAVFPFAKPNRGELGGERSGETHRKRSLKSSHATF